MLSKLKKWFGFPMANSYQEEIKKNLLERLEELNMTEKKKAPAKKAPAKKAPAKKAPAKKAPAKKKSGGGSSHLAV